jgi:hypothetical protein
MSLNSKFKIQNSRFRVQGSGFRVQGSRSAHHPILNLEF